MANRILLIEDDASLSKALDKVLRSEGYECTVVARGDEGLQRALAEPVDLVITDLKLPGLDGLQVVGRLHPAKPQLPIIVMTAHGTTETAIEATKLGAFEYLIKPCEADELLALVGSALAHAKLMSQPVDLGDLQDGSYALVGSSRVMQNLYKEIGRVAATPVTVLIRGETGAGKELVARAIFEHSNRAGKPFVAVNCAAIPETLLESELFGHERGAFTGAQSRRIGRFEQANGGTLFLDEVGDLYPNTQAKLLRVLQERHIQRLGGDETIPVDVRVIAATHRNLENAIQEKEFREDLYFRLSVVTIRLPTLAERQEDIPDLVRYLIHRYARELAIDNPSIHPDAVAFLQRQSWPGNVRELENVIRQALLLARPFGIGLDHVELVFQRNKRTGSVAGQTHAAYIAELLNRAQRGEITDVYARLIADLEPELYSQAIRLAQGNQAKAARWLGVTRLKIREKLTQYGLHPASGSKPEPETDGGKISEIR